MVDTVKEIINETGEVTGYLVDGKLSVPLAEGNRHYREVQEWIAEGNTPAPADPIPEPEIVVSPWQFRKALNQQGLRQTVEDSVAASSDYAIKDGWEYATEFRETDPLVQSMAQAIGVTETELHNLFVLAETL